MQVSPKVFDFFFFNLNYQVCKKVITKPEGASKLCMVF